MLCQGQGRVSPVACLAPQMDTLGLGTELWGSGHSDLPKNPVDKYISCASVIFKAPTLPLQIEIIQQRSFQFFPYLINSDKKAMLGLNLFILHNRVTL